MSTTAAQQKPAPGELLRAIQDEDAKVVADLLRRDADVHEKTDLGRNMLGLAISLHRPEVVRLLIDEGGADINAKSDGENGWTPLAYAVLFHDKDTLRLLIDKGADLTITDDAGDTAQGIAEKQGFTEMAQLLKEASQLQQDRAKAAKEAEAAKVQEQNATAAQKQQRLNAVRKPLTIRGPQL